MLQHNKDIEQKKALNLWWKNKCKGFLELPTGFGKTRVGVLASSYIYNKVDNCKILIVTPTISIKEEWINEFKKWKKTKVLSSVDIQCINTAREYSGNNYDLIILDECHNYFMGAENSKVFKNNSYEAILGLSATIDNSLLEELNKVAPIVYSMDLNTAVELGLVSNYTILNLSVELTTEERLEYNRLSEIIDYSYQVKGRHSWKNISLRKELLYKASNKFKMVESLVNLFNNDYGVIFSMTKDYADLIQSKFSETCVIHHSGISKKNRIENLKNYSDGRTKIRLLSSAKTLDEGINLPRVKYAIIMASSSKPLQSTQRVGRILRISEDKDKAYIIRLYVKDTKEESWIKTSQSKLKVINISSIEELKEHLYDKR